MRRSIIWGLMLVVIFANFASAEVLKIGLVRRFKDIKTVSISCTDKFQISDKSGAVVMRSNPGDKISFQVNESKILLIDASGDNISADPPFSITTSNTDARLILYRDQNDNGSRYRGKIIISMNKSGMLLINELDLEDYLLGVLPCEMPEAYHMEALKAQAVAARSYALANRNKHLSQGFSLCDSYDCQIYGGADVERPNSTAAVRSTAGIVAAYNGKTISAQYTGDCGGITADGGRPYLQSVVDQENESVDNCENSRHTWSVAWNVADFENKLKTAYLNLSGVKNVKVEKTPSGRPYLVKIEAESGNIELTTAKLRTLLGVNTVRSTYFDAKIIDSTIILSGKGFGHGVGMCQIGANNLAKRGSSFEQILQHYYKGVKIIALSDMAGAGNQ